MITGTTSNSVLKPQVIHWRIIQYLLLILSIILVTLLIYQPTLGLNIFWNVLIPIAPAVVVVAPGLWRNICPMATLSMLPRSMGISKQGSPSQGMTALLSLGGFLALYIIVPYRHLSLDTNGLHSALMLIIAGLTAFLFGIAFKWRAGWCTTLCPIHPVERLYGIAPAATFINAHCAHCEHCTAPCPDSTKSMTAAITGPSPLSSLVGHIVIGSFAGFIWGWNQVPDYSGAVTMAQYIYAYIWPIGAATITLAIYGMLYRWIFVTKEGQKTVVKVFATAAVTTYYWFRIPALVGFGPYPGTGMLYDLSAQIPAWTEHLSHIITSAFFIWFMLIRKNPKISWMIRPPLLTSHKKRIE